MGSEKSCNEEKAMHILARHVDLLKLCEFFTARGLMVGDGKYPIKELMNFLNSQMSTETFFTFLQGMEECGARQIAYEVRLSMGRASYQWIWLHQDGRVLMQSLPEFGIPALCLVDAMENKSSLEFNNPILRIIAYTSDGMKMGAVREVRDVGTQTK